MCWCICIGTTHNHKIILRLYFFHVPISSYSVTTNALYLVYNFNNFHKIKADVKFLFFYNKITYKYLSEKKDNFIALRSNNLKKNYKN